MVSIEMDEAPKGTGLRRTAPPPHETLVSDARAGLTPSQMVERRLVSMLRSTLLPASHLQVSRTRRALS
jgi:hypothetical protein